MPSKSLMKNFFKSSPIPKDLLVFLFFGFLVTLKFWNFLNPWDRIYLISDFPELMPLREFFYQQLREGRLVLWDSHLGTGLPYLAADFGAFYPPDLLVGLFANFYNVDRLQVQMALHYWLAGMFTYGYTRQQGLPRFSAAVSGMCFMLGGFLLSHLHHRNIVHTFIWLPLILYCLDRALAQRKLLWAMTAGLFLSFSFLAGNANFFYYILLLIALYYLFRLGSLFQEKVWGRVLAETGYFITAGLFCLGLSAVQLLPMITSILASSQAEASYAWKVQGSFSILHLVHLLTPILWASKDASEDFAYLGLFPLLLACWVWLPAKEKMVKFFSLAALFGFLLALGDQTSLFKVLYDVLPGLQLFRIPSRGISLTAFSLAVLAGFGCHYLIQEARRREIVVLARSLRGLFYFSLGGGLLAYCLLYFSAPFQVEAVGKSLNIWIEWISRYTFYLLLLGTAYLIVLGRRRAFPLGTLKTALVIFISLDLLIVNLNFGPDIGKGDHLSYQDPARIPEYSRAAAGELKKETTPFRISDPEGLIVLNTIYQDNFSIYDLERAPGYVARFLPPEYVHLAEAAMGNPQLLDLLNVTF
ncbi:MAG: YfhO family protein, partial [Deltaproteobacteria bacterium]|nr:YfhO family protein [Deltaproteobacteria bacterium]